MQTFPSLLERLAWALAEDIGAEDITSAAVAAHTRPAHGRCIAKDTGVIAGIQWAEKVLLKDDTGVTMEIHLADGAACEPGQIVFEVYGNSYTLLTRERLVLNLLQRLSGIATLTRRYTEALAGTGCQILDTRKTTPLWRDLEKWAVQIGGGINHRMGLYDEFLIKDNHIDLAGSVSAAIEAVLRYRTQKGLQAPIVVEVRNLREIGEALAYAEHLSRLLLDNFRPDQVARAVEYIGGQLPVEVSGGITPENARAYAEAGAKYISAGALTHSARALDLSLKIRPLS